MLSAADPGLHRGRGCMTLACHRTGCPRSLNCSEEPSSQDCARKGCNLINLKSIVPVASACLWSWFAFALTCPWSRFLSALGPCPPLVLPWPSACLWPGSAFGLNLPLACAFICLGPQPISGLGLPMTSGCLWHGPVFGSALSLYLPLAQAFACLRHAPVSGSASSIWLRLWPSQ